MTDSTRRDVDRSGAPLPRLFDLTGRTCLITGASGWLGRALSRGLAEAGARVVVTSRDRERAERARDELPGRADHVAVVLDHMDEDSIEHGFRETLDRTERIDVLVSNGHEHATSPEGPDASLDGFARHLRNAAGYYGLARRVRDHAVERGGGASIVQLGSMYGRIGSYPDAYEGVSPPSPVAYHTLKGGIVHMTRRLAVYWAKDGVRVNSLSPGPFPGASAPGDLVERLEEKSPMGRMGEPWELAGAVVFLASDASSYVTGHDLVVDGGWSAW